MIKMTIDDSGAYAMLDGISDNLTNLTPIWRNIHAYMISRLLMQFNTLGEGGSARGVNWPDFKFQYMRRNGFRVPAAGGVAKIHNPSEKVLGRLRGNTNKRVTASSKLMQDRGIMRNALLQKFSYGKNTLKMDTADSKEKVVFQNSHRPFQFFEVPKDVNVIVEMVRKGIVRKN